MSDHDAAQTNRSATKQDPTGDKSKPGPASASTGKAKPQGNPALRALGLPNWRIRLPSRNWTIFLSITGSFTAAIVYDRRQKKAIQKKWCTLVEHLAQEPLPASSLARRVTIVLAAPPGDGIRVTREHFTEYVKPILVAGALDWDVIEGRREGEVRASLADRIRRLRRYRGEQAKEPLKPDVPTALSELRDRMGIDDYQGPKGDLVIGRHTWKEYIRGLHEGWLGPLDAPTEANIAPTESTTDATTNASEDASEQGVTSSDDASPAAKTGESSATEKSSKPAADKPAKPAVTPPYNLPASYQESPLPQSCPEELQASIPITLPHILGIRNTPIRMYRFLTRRHMADQIGRQTAAAVLAAYRPYNHDTSLQGAHDGVVGASSDADSMQTFNDQWEQQSVLTEEESTWPKSIRKRKDGEGERAWLDSMIIDPRIGERMRKFELQQDEEDRADRIAKNIPGSSRRIDPENGGDENAAE